MSTFVNVWPSRGVAPISGFDKSLTSAFTPVTAHTEDRERDHGLGTEA